MLESTRFQSRLTPWDERVLGVKSGEFLFLDTLDPQSAISELEAWAIAHNVKYLCGRVDSNERVVREALRARGYEFIETSTTLSRAGFAELPKMPRGMTVDLRMPDQHDIQWLEALAQNAFHHGRLIEDLSVAESASRQRTANWVRDLIERKQLSVAEARGKTVGFHAESIRSCGKVADLILTGADQRYAMFALPIWIAALQRLSEAGIERCETLISSSNVGVTNLYAQLGFKFQKSLAGYRRYL